MIEHPLVIFDSGIGGFSILKTLLNTDFKRPIIYLADQANLPYGEKSASWIQTKLKQVATWTNSFKPSAFILACNTATVSGVKELRAWLNCPVVAIEPVIKPLLNYKHPLLLATQTTLKQTQTPPNFIKLYPQGLVQAIEAIDTQQINTILTSFKELIAQYSIDAMGLSCTHYPLIKSQLSQLYPDLHLVDPSIAVVNHFLTNINHFPNSSLELSFYTTGDPTTFNLQVQYYLSLKTKAKRFNL